MFRNILVAFDGSEASRNAYDMALDLAKKYSSDVHVVAVVQPPEFAEMVEMKAAIESGRAHLDRQLGALRVKGAQAGLEPRLNVVVGHPAVQIVRAAEESNVDLIILGHRGHGRLERWLLGSVSQAVIAQAGCAVMVVHEKSFTRAGRRRATTTSVATRTYRNRSAYG